MEQNQQENLNENKLENKGSNEGTKQIAGAIILAGVLIAGAIILKGGGATNLAQQDIDNLQEIEIKPISKDDHILGDLNAQIVVIEYSDFECPFCKVFHNTMHEVLETNNGNVAWVYRQFPIYQGPQPLHSKALKESEASECAAELAGNDGFWKYANRMFEITNSNNSLDLNQLPVIAGDIGLDVQKFNTCLSSGKYKKIIDASIEEGVKAGVQGTPKSFLLTKKEITPKMQKEIVSALKIEGAVSFSGSNKNLMTMNGALPIEMVESIIKILLK